MPWLVLRFYALKERLQERAKTRPRRRLGAGGFFVFAAALLFTSTPVHASPLNVDAVVQTFAEFSFSIVGALMKAIVLMIDVLIPIMTYNNFVGNPVVKAGWAIVRDTVNMFFVIILIIIAFGTIFGHKRFQWAQQVPRLLIWAIVINFSKTLCGIMIDFGQVIMLTFANALREIAAGNFIQLLGLNKVYQISQNSEAIKSIGTGTDTAKATLEAFDFFAAGLVSVAMTLFVLSTLIVLVSILLFRIIMLWILVVIAPLAWFVKGAEGVITSDAYKEWWTEFKCMVGVGPILTFFLWLTLAVAGAGSIAVNSGFEVAAGTNAANFTSAGLEPTNFLSFLIGMAMLVAGWKAATQFCGGMGGQFLGKAAGLAKRLPIMAAGAAGGVAAGAGALGLKGAGKGAQLGARGLAATPAALASVGRRLPGSAWVSREVGSARESVKTGIWKRVEGLGRRSGIRTLEQAGIAGKGKAKAQAGMARMEGVNKATEKLKGQDRDTNLNLMKQYATAVKGGAKLSTNEEAEYLALMDMMMGDSRMQKAARADGTFQAAWGQMGGRFERLNAHDSAKTDQIKDFKKTNADVTDSADLIDSYEDVKNLSDEAVTDPKVQAKLRRLKSNVRGADGEMLSAYDAIAGGHVTDKKQAALTSGESGMFDRMGSAELLRVDVKALGAQGGTDVLQRAIEAALLAGEAGRAKDIVAQMTGRYVRETNPDKKMDMLLALDSTAGRLKKNSESGDAKGVLKYLEGARTMAETASPPPPARLGEGQSGAAFVEGMKDASDRRKKRAVREMDEQDEERETQLKEVETQRDNFVGDRESVIQDELLALAQSLANARTQIDADLNLGTQLTAAQKRLADLEKNPNAPKKWKDDAKQEVSTLQTQYDAARQRLASPEQTQIDNEWYQKQAELKAQLDAAKKALVAVQNSPHATKKWKDDAQQKVNALQGQYDAAKKPLDSPEYRAKIQEADPRTKQIQAQIDVKMQQVGNMSDAEKGELEALNNRVAKLTTQGQEIAKAIRGLS